MNQRLAATTDYPPSVAREARDGAPERMSAFAGPPAGENRDLGSMSITRVLGKTPWCAGCGADAEKR